MGVDRWDGGIDWLWSWNGDLMGVVVQLTDEKLWNRIEWSDWKGVA